MENSTLTILRQNLHREPEISNQEFNTSAMIQEFLKSSKPDRVLTLGPTALLFIYDSQRPGPTVVFRAELDALPIKEESDLPYRSVKKGISHACGHDGHMTILAGLGQQISSNRPVKGRAVLLFQHAEEVEQGARDIVENQEFKSLHPTFLFALHNIPGEEMHKIIVREGSMTAASCGMTVSLRGKSSHAAEPQKGINPALAISEIIQSMNKLMQDKKLFRELTILTVINIKMGEKSFGTSPGNAELNFTLRAFRNEDMEKLISESERIIEQIAGREKLRFEISYSEEFPATENNAECVELLKKAAIENSLELKVSEKPYPWSEDFSYYTREYRGCLFGIGAGTSQPSLHNPDYDFPDELIETGVNLFKTIYNKLLL